MDARTQVRRWHLFPDAAALFEGVRARVQCASQLAQASRGEFRIVLSGGQTPQALYERLRELTTDWSRWHVYWGDERCLPRESAQRNSASAMDAWLDHVPIPRPQIHPIEAERGPAEAARRYRERVRGVTLDLVLLGLGEDGHTASLFPGHDWGAPRDAEPVLAVSRAPKPPPERVSLSARTLSSAREVIFLVTGASKRQAVELWQGGHRIPAAAIAPSAGVDICLAGTGCVIAG
ncbi:MAG: 6-phosphogluconolactonase [Betaproteobacteria bacterium]|nr:6-phosphogluconolactonase [Betaproteobacteria bacterium]